LMKSRRDLLSEYRVLLEITRSLVQVETYGRVEEELDAAFVPKLREIYLRYRA